MESPHRFIMGILSGKITYPRSWQLDQCNGFVRAELVWKAFDEWQNLNPVAGHPVEVEEFFKAVPPNAWGSWPDTTLVLPRMMPDGSCEFLPHYRFYPHVRCRPPLARSAFCSLE